MKATEEQGLKTIALDKAEPSHQSFTEKASKEDFFAKGSLKDRPDKDDQYRLPGPARLLKNLDARIICRGQNAFLVKPKIG